MTHDQLNLAIERIKQRAVIDAARLPNQKRSKQAAYLVDRMSERISALEWSTGKSMYELESFEVDELLKAYDKDFKAKLRELNGKRS